MTSRHTRISGSLVLLLVAAGSIAACSSSPTKADAELPQQNIDQWVMPLDQYSLQRDDAMRGEYAAVLLEKPCMESAGYAYDVPWRDLTNTRRATFNAVQRRIFDADIAAHWGYHIAPSAESTFDDWIAFGDTLGKLDTGGLAVLQSCIAQGQEELPPIHGMANYVSGIINVAYEDAYSDEAVVGAVTQWRQCMLPFGLADLPEAPRYMPPPSLSEDQSGELASPQEIEIAMNDAACRESSGYAEALYQAEWDRQVKLLGDNIDDLERARTVLEDDASLVKSIIASHPIAHSG